MAMLLILGSRPEPVLPPEGSLEALAGGNASGRSAAHLGLPSPTFTVITAARHKDNMVPLMTEHGYELASRHYTRSGQKRIVRGEDPEGYAYNAIFRPMTGTGSEALRKAPAIDIEAKA